MMRLQAWLSLLLAVSAAVYGKECNLGWEPNGDNCYRFVAYPEQSYDEAMQKCINEGSTLLSVTDYTENSFIVSRVQALSSQQNSGWYTSGRNNYWEGDGTRVPTDAQYWLDPRQASVSDKEVDDKVIIYQRNKDGDFKFKRVTQTVDRFYICEIAKAEVNRMYQSHRDYSYGLNELTHRSSVPSAPHIISNPDDTVIIGKPEQIFLECIAIGNPSPKYEWYRGRLAGHVIENQQINRITTARYARYTLTNGRLTISKPDPNKDGGDYQCRINNKHGTLLGNPVKLTFGVLGHFQNVDPSPVNSKGDKGAQIGCPPIESKPARRYQWSKDYVLNFVRPQSNPHIFISSNGGLYFSRVQQDDAGKYYCMVTLDAPGKSQGYLGSQKVVSRISRPVQMNVDIGDGGDQKPVIQNDFINVYPKVPTATLR